MAKSSSRGGASEKVSPARLKQKSGSSHSFGGFTEAHLAPGGFRMKRRGSAK